MARPRPASHEPDGPREHARDQAILRAIADGDADAFSALWKRYGRAVHALSRAIVRDEDVAEDAVQETFLRIWRAAASYDADRGAPAAWIMTVARNVARTAARAEGERPVPARPPSGDHADGVVDRLWIGGALARLPEHERIAVELSYFADLSHAQVAARLGEPLGTVKARIRRGLLRLGDEAGGR